MCQKQQYLQLYKISTRVFVQSPRWVENEDPPQNHLETARNRFWRLLDTKGLQETTWLLTIFNYTKFWPRSSSELMPSLVSISFNIFITDDRNVSEILLRPVCAWTWKHIMFCVNLLCSLSQVFCTWIVLQLHLINLYWNNFVPKKTGNPCKYLLSCKLLMKSAVTHTPATCFSVLRKSPAQKRNASPIKF